jgi:hypothetical protein
VVVAVVVVVSVVVVVPVAVVVVLLALVVLPPPSAEEHAPSRLIAAKNCTRDRVSVLIDDSLEMAAEEPELSDHLDGTPSYSRCARRQRHPHAGDATQLRQLLAFL